MVVLKSLITKGSWTIVEKEGRKMDFPICCNFPPVQMSIFKESHPLEDESTFEESPIFDLTLQNLNNQNWFLFLFKYKLKS